MPKLTETYAGKIPNPVSGTKKYWDSEIKGLGLFVGKRTKTWYFQKDIGGRTRRVLIGRFPIIAAAAARQAAQSLALDMSRGAGKVFQTGAPTLERAMEAYLARPKLRSETGKHVVRQQLHKHLGDWMRLPLDELKGTQCPRNRKKEAALRSLQRAWIGQRGASKEIAPIRSKWRRGGFLNETSSTLKIVVDRN